MVDQAQFKAFALVAVKLFRTYEPDVGRAMDENKKCPWA